MRRAGRQLRLRIARPRWPSKDHRDYQTVSRLRARRSRRSQTPTRINRSGGAEPSGLIRIISIHREQALLHVELLAHRAALDRRLPTGVPDSSGRPIDVAKSQRPPASAVGGTWTEKLSLN